MFVDEVGPPDHRTVSINSSSVTHQFERVLQPTMWKRRHRRHLKVDMISCVEFVVFSISTTRSPNTTLPRVS